MWHSLLSEIGEILLSCWKRLAGNRLEIKLGSNLNAKKDK